jgi:hypothetical protein
MKIYAKKTKNISKQTSIYHHKINYLTLARLILSFLLTNLTMDRYHAKVFQASNKHFAYIYIYDFDLWDLKFRVFFIKLIF